MSLSVGFKAANQKLALWLTKILNHNIIQGTTIK